MSDANHDYSPAEMMVVKAAEQLEDGAVTFVGVGLPVLAANLAGKTHAPRLISAYEGGFLRGTPSPSVAFAIDDPVLATGADMTGDMHATMSMMYRGEVEYAFLGGAQVDKYGNINSTGIGDFDDNREEFKYIVGSGGANDMGSNGHKTIIMMPHTPKKLVEEVDFLTTPGYLDGPGSREEVGLPPDTGPETVITTKGILKFDEETKEAYLQAHYPGEDIEEIKRQTGWDLDVADDVYEVEPPRGEQLELLREDIDPEGLYL